MTTSSHTFARQADGVDLHTLLATDKQIREDPSFGPAASVPATSGSTAPTTAPP
jgi:hypothetical protein